MFKSVFAGLKPSTTGKRTIRNASGGQRTIGARPAGPLSARAAGARSQAQFYADTGVSGLGATSRTRGRNARITRVPQVSSITPETLRR